MARHAKTVMMLVAAMKHISSVPHSVGLRWVFYRLLQDGVLTCKGDYNKLKKATISARKEFRNGWKPDTLEDAGRTITTSRTPRDRAGMLELLPYYVDLIPNLYAEQDCVPFLIYESATSDGQFDYFVPWCDRASLRGDASIPHKWNIAKRCDELSKQYGLPVRVLYFGDLDTKGLQIPESAMKDIIEWAKCDVSYTRCGLTAAQAQRFDLPKRPGSPGVYEWEGLNSEDAGIVIKEALESILNLGAIEIAIKTSEDETGVFSDEIREALLEVQL